MTDDDRLKQALGELTRQRARAAPDLDRLLEPRATHGRRWIVYAAAAAALVVVVLAGFLLNRDLPDDELTMAQLENVASWRAPTDVFLPAVEGVLPSRVPPLGQTALQFYTGAPQARTPNDEVSP